MVGIIVLYDFIMLFLIIILAVKLVFFVHSLWVAGSFVRTREYFLPFELAVQFHHNLRRKWFFMRSMNRWYSDFSFDDVRASVSASIFWRDRSRLMRKKARSYVYVPYYLKWDYPDFTPWG